MRGAEALLIAAFIGLIGMGVWNVRQWLPDFGFGETRYIPADPSKLATGLADKEGAKTSRARGKRGEKSGRDTSDISIDRLPVSTTVVDVPVSGFPTGKDLPVGTSSNQIRSQYGEPTASVTAIAAVGYSNTTTTSIRTARNSKATWRAELSSQPKPHYPESQPSSTPSAAVEVAPEQIQTGIVVLPEVFQRTSMKWQNAQSESNQQCWSPCEPNDRHEGRDRGVWPSQRGPVDSHHLHHASMPGFADDGGGFLAWRIRTQSGRTQPDASDGTVFRRRSL